MFQVFLSSTFFNHIRENMENDPPTYLPYLSRDMCRNLLHVSPSHFCSSIGQELSLRNPIDVEIGEHLLVMGGSGEKPEVHVRSSETKGDEGYIDIL
jgi:hypothetical protein